MKKLIKIFLFLLCLITQVHAEEYTDSFIDKVEWISGDYVIKQKGSSKKYQQMYTIQRKSDKRFVYCIEPGVSINQGRLVKGYDEDILDVTKFSEQEWDRITKLAYYGYGYKDNKYDHTGIHWYTITQFMIWKTVPNGYDIYLGEPKLGKNYKEYDYDNKIALVFGNERFGINQNWYNNKSIKVFIPMEGPHNSLNVGVAASIILYEAYMKRKYKEQR